MTPWYMRYLLRDYVCTIVGAIAIAWAIIPPTPGRPELYFAAGALLILSGFPHTYLKRRRTK